jgi:hypothetical protein
MACRPCGCDPEANWVASGCEKGCRTREQPRPIRNDSTAIQDLVIQDLRSGLVGFACQAQLVAAVEARKALGLERYGTLLQAFNGRDCVRDAREEALDLVQYLRQGIEEGRVDWSVYRLALRLLEVLHGDPS